MHRDLRNVWLATALSLAAAARAGRIGTARGGGRRGGRGGRGLGGRGGRRCCCRGGPTGGGPVQAAGPAGAVAHAEAAGRDR
jgi:hypothetical protein